MVEKFAVVSVQLAALTDALRPLLKFYVAHPKAVNAANAQLLPIMLATRVRSTNIPVWNLTLILILLLLLLSDKCPTANGHWTQCLTYFKGVQVLLGSHVVVTGSQAGTLMV